MACSGYTTGDFKSDKKRQRRRESLNHYNTAILSDGDGSQALGRSHGARCREDLLQLFQCAADSLDAKQVPEKGLDEVPTDKDIDVLV